MNGNARDLDTYNDFEDDAPDGRCHGPAYFQAHGCGRFSNAPRCARCQAETDAYWSDERIAEWAYVEGKYEEGDLPF